MTLSPRDRILLGVIIVVVAVFGFYHVALSPQRHRAASLDTQVTAAQAALASAQDRYSASRAAASSLHTEAPTWAAAQRAVPRDSDVPDLLRLLERSAHAAHVTMHSISFTGATESSGVTGATGSTGSGDATEIPVSLEFGGGYQALNRLLARLDNLVVVSGGQVRASGPLVGISNVSLSGDDQGLTVDLTAVIYQHAAASTVLGSIPEGSS